MVRASERSVRFDIELTPQVNKEIEQMAASEGGRSKRSFVSLLMFRIARAAKTNPEELERLGLTRKEIESQGAP
jgi:hypothetical protein